MNWLKLQNSKGTPMGRGTTLMLRAPTPNEDSTIMMICEGFLHNYAVMALTGTNAGINPFTIIPHHRYDDSSLLAGKIYDNWQTWFHIGSPGDVSFSCTVYPNGITTFLNFENIKEITKKWLQLAEKKNHHALKGGVG